MTLFKTTEFTGNDLDLYFKKSIVRLVAPDDKAEWVWYVGNNSKAFEFQRSSGAEGAFKLDKAKFKTYRIEVMFPSGFRNTKTSVVFGERIGTRQNLKGLHSGINYQLIPVESILLHYIDNTALNMKLFALGEKSRLTPVLANFIFEEQKFCELKEAVVQIRSRKALARALSPLFAVVPHHALKDYLVFFQDIPVAEITTKDLKMKILVPELESEIREFLEPQGARVLSK